MSRVDDAMRRAAEEAQGLDGTGAPAPVEGEDSVSLAREPFPIEMPDRRAKSEGSARPAAASARPQEPASRPTSPPAPREKLFERLDVNLAQKVVADETMLPAVREQYRRLAAILHDAQSTRNLQVIMVASAVAGEGKTLTASNLALTLSESYQKRVLLIDADLRRPALHQVFKIDTSSGLTDGLAPGGTAKLVVRQVSPKLAVLPAGRPTSDPMAGLISERMQRLIEEAREGFDWVIVDTPPLLLLPDAHLLASMVDGAIIVIRAESTPYDMVKRATDAIGKNRILGVVLNQTSSGKQGTYNEYHEYYYSAKPRTPGSP